MSIFHTQGRSRYISRNSKGLEGVIELEMVVDSKYLHVGSGRKDVKLIKKIENMKDLVEKALKGEWPDVESYFSREVNLLNKQGGKIVIPGSTIKGLIRSRLELSLTDACYIVSGRTASSSKVYKKIFHYPNRRDRDNFDPDERPYVCRVCNLLGNSGLASRVSFSDFIMTSGKVVYISKGRAVYEVVTKDSKFVGKVVYRSIKSEEELGMLLYGFGLRQDGSSKVMLLGRFKFSDRQFGRVKFSVKHMNINVVKKYLTQFQNQFKPRDFNEEW